MIANEIQIENLVSIEKQLFLFPLHLRTTRKDEWIIGMRASKLHFTFQAIRIVVMQTMMMMKASGQQIENKIYF